MIHGYARTSTVDQLAGLAGQERDLRAAGAERIFSEHASAATLQRPELEACLAALKMGDVLMVTKPDRLARSTAHLLEIVESLNRRNVGLILLSMGGERIDSRNPTSKLLLTMLAAIAAFERDIMLERQREGIERARKEGKYKGRKSVVDRSDALAMAADGLTGLDIAARLGVSKSAVYRTLAHP